MAYIGVQPTDNYLSIASQQITGTGSATYTLDYSVSTEEDVAVFVNNVRQNVSSYTVSGTSLTLGGTISASDECWVLFLGRTVGTKTPAVGSVTNDMLAGSIANAKLANSSVTVNGTSISLGASGTISAGITMADTWRVTTNFTPTNNTLNYITANWERHDSTGNGAIGTGMTESSGVFTFPSTGIYFVFFMVEYFSSNTVRFLIQGISYTNDNSNYNQLGFTNSFMVGGLGGDGYHNSVISQIVDITDTSNDKVKFDLYPQNTLTVNGSSVLSRTYVQFIRLGDT